MEETRGCSSASLDAIRGPRLEESQDAISSPSGECCSPRGLEILTADRPRSDGNSCSADTSAAHRAGGRYGPPSAWGGDESVRPGPADLDPEPSMPDWSHRDPVDGL